MQMTGDHIPIAAVIAFSADDQSRSALGIEPHQHIGSAAAGIFHENDAGHAELLDRPAIDFAHLGSGERRHGASRSNVIPLVNTCNCKPVAALRLPTLPAGT